MAEPEAPPQVLIDVTGYRIVKPPSGKEYAVFIVKIQLGQFVWTVYRRFSSFTDLYDRLKKIIPETPACPPKRPFTPQTPEFLDHRRLELLNWIRSLANDARVCASPQFHEFLKAQANMAPEGAEPAVMASSTRSSSGGSADAGTPPRTPPRARRSDMDDMTPASPGRKPVIRDFVLLKVVGKGSFGKVMQVRSKLNGRIYAMKVLRKSNIVKRNQVEHTRTERNVLGRIDHPFIVGLNFAFQSKSKLFFVLDYCAGGELFFHLGKEGRFSQRRSAFYTAQIVLALEHLHGLNIIYRDLKPENVLLDHLGNVRLTDFGLSKENVQETDSGAHSFCGTPEYLAPEILHRKGHGRAVDWWSLGALLYEMLTGLPPFYCRDRVALFAKIKSGDLVFPDFISEEARDLLEGLLCRDPNKRLGCGPSDAEEIKRHAFFASLDWDALLACRLSPPWRPDIVGSLDTSQFDSEFTTMPIVSPRSRADSRLHDAINFDGFTFVAPTNIGEASTGAEDAGAGEDMGDGLAEAGGTEDAGIGDDGDMGDYVHVDRHDAADEDGDALGLGGGRPPMAPKPHVFNPSARPFHGSSAFGGGSGAAPALPAYGGGSGHTGWHAGGGEWGGDSRFGGHSDHHYSGGFGAGDTGDASMVGSA